MIYSSLSNFLRPKSMNLLRCVTQDRSWSPRFQELQKKAENRADAPVEFPYKVDRSKLAKILPDHVYHVTMEGGTEKPGTGRHFREKRSGMFSCVICGENLFSSEKKYTSQCGWPSFTASVSDDSIRMFKDSSHGMIRIETVCSNCGSHLGHVFDDGPAPSRLRYCINSASLNFTPAETD